MQVNPPVFLPVLPAFFATEAPICCWCGAEANGLVGRRAFKVPAARGALGIQGLYFMGMMITIGFFWWDYTTWFNGDYDNIEAVARKPINQPGLIMRWDRGILMAKVEHQLIGLQKIFVLFSPCRI